MSTFMHNVNEHFDVDLNRRTHLVGFSLGAHVAGFAGADLKELKRITGRSDRQQYSTEISFASQAKIKSNGSIIYIYLQ